MPIALFYYQPIETDYGIFEQRISVGTGRLKGYTDEGKAIIKVNPGKKIFKVLNEGKTLFCELR